MIDIETELFSVLSSAVYSRYPNVYMTGEDVKSPSEFPCVSLVEANNATLEKTQTTQGTENHAVLMYELNVYSNKTVGKKAECKEIAAFIDGLLLQWNFTRIILEPVPNRDSATVYRMLGRYRAIVSQNKTIFRR